MSVFDLVNNLEVLVKNERLKTDEKRGALGARIEKSLAITIDLQGID